MKTKIRNKLPRLYEFLYYIRLNYISYYYHKILMWFGPTKIIKKKYKNKIGKNINLDTPKTFNEKLNWLKLNWYDDKAVICSNKYLVREYVEEKGLSHILVELFFVVSNVKDIDFDNLPESCVLKTTNHSGGIVFKKEGEPFNKRKAKRVLSRQLKMDYSVFSAEWQYKYSDKYVICEEFLSVPGEEGIKDFKFYCYNGKPKYIHFVKERFDNMQSYFFDLKWNQLPFSVNDKFEKCDEPKPKNLDKMIEYAKKLSEDLVFVRVDFYNVLNKIYLSELTFFPWGGFQKFYPKEVDSILGKKIILPDKATNPWGNTKI